MLFEELLREKKRLGANGDSIDNYESYSIPEIFPITLSTTRGREVNYHLGFGGFIDVALFEPQLKIPSRPDPIKELSKLMGVKKESAQSMFIEIENDVDQFCKEERIRFLNSDEKAELVLGMMRAISGLGKKISKRLE